MVKTGKKLKIYTDGSANKKSCGHAYVVTDEEDNIIYYDCIYVNESTNNREEIEAILSAYRYIKGNYHDDVTIYSDSAYCVNMLNEWIENWYHAGWKKYDGKEICNLDLVEKLYRYKHMFPNVKIKKTEGHAGIKGNEIADALAQGKLDKFKKLLTN